ncbi:MAG: cytochrome c [Gammaproteobacteria bacterium]|nr:cytochrome c [Gammaproteobacteria bacterium]
MFIITLNKQVRFAGFAMCLVSGLVMAQGYGGPYGFGSAPSAEELAKIDIDVMPDGRGAPPGQGTYAEGKQVYEGKCVACHGADFKGVKGTGGAALIGGRGSLSSGKPAKTVESYWPYASTFFDYVRRAMPFNAPGSLSANEVYAVTAYILGEANIIGKDQVVSAKNIASIEMPNRDGFIRDPRPDIFNYD